MSYTIRLVAVAMLAILVGCGQGKEAEPVKDAADATVDAMQDSAAAMGEASTEAMDSAAEATGDMADDAAAATNEAMDDATAAPADSAAGEMQDAKDADPEKSGS